MLLGVAFLVSQLLAWQQLQALGTLPCEQFAQFVLLSPDGRARRAPRGRFIWAQFPVAPFASPSDEAAVPERQASADAVSIYWHFMDALWIYLFLLLFLWR